MIDKSWTETNRSQKEKFFYECTTRAHTQRQIREIHVYTRIHIYRKSHTILISLRRYFLAEMTNINNGIGKSFK